MSKYPNRRVDQIIENIERYRFSTVTLGFILAYCALAFAFGVGYFVFAKVSGQQTFQPFCNSFESCLYFSFISQLTIGYGDIEPLGFARILAVIQTLLGVMLAGVWIGLAVLKITSPAWNSIVFSRYAFYNLSDERFVVLFVNANRQKLINVTISTMVKLAGQNRTFLAHSIPYIGESVWILSLDKLSLDELQPLCESLVEGDCLKVSISGSYGFATYTNAQKYTLKEVNVIENKSFEETDVFEEPSLDKDFWRFFNDPVPDAHNLKEYLWNEQ